MFKINPTPNEISQPSRLLSLLRFLLGAKYTIDASKNALIKRHIIHSYLTNRKVKIVLLTDRVVKFFCESLKYKFIYTRTLIV